MLITYQVSLPELICSSFINLCSQLSNPWLCIPSSSFGSFFTFEAFSSFLDLPRFPYNENMINYQCMLKTNWTKIYELPFAAYYLIGLYPQFGPSDRFFYYDHIANKVDISSSNLFLAACVDFWAPLQALSFYSA